MSAALPSDFAIRIPQYIRRCDPKVETGDLLVQGEARSAPSPMPVVLWQIQVGEVILRAKAPIRINFSTAGEFVVAENESLRVMGFGSTREDAVEQFREHIVHLYDSYTALSEDQVIGEGARLRTIYANSFERV